MRLLAKNPAFVDGHRRAAFLAVGLFLLGNGQRLRATPADATLTMLDVATGQQKEQEFARWLREHTPPRGGHAPHQNRKYRCAMGRRVAGSQVSSSPLARTA